MTRFWIDDDASGEPTVWTGDPEMPLPILRRYEIRADEDVRDEVLALIAPTTASESTQDDERARVVWRDRGERIAALEAENEALTRECLDREATEMDARAQLAALDVSMSESSGRGKQR